MELGRRCTAVAAAILLTLADVEPASAKPRPGHPRRGLNLFAFTFGVLNVNRVFCGITNVGQICIDPTGSGVTAGGFWPRGTPDAYVFNSGLQLAGTIPATAGFAWAGDTVGAFFMDPTGFQAQGDPVTLVYNSLDPGDDAAWPNGGIVRDTQIYASVLLDRQKVSQQDLWVRTWDGNPQRSEPASTHPMGVLVEERGMGWNFPTGNEDIVYFVYTFYNVTARTASAYNALHPKIRGEIAALGADFQNRSEARYGLDIPDDGYAITNLFAAFFADMDVANFDLNYATPVIPFAMGVTYDGSFHLPSWSYPPEIFGPPFVPSPGFVGVKYLRSPLDSTGQPVGLTIFSNTLNSLTGYPDPIGVKQLFRYLSGTSSPGAGDFPCTFQGQQLALHFCFFSPNGGDVRFFQSSGPMTLEPGRAQSIVVAYLFAAPTDAVAPFIGGDFKPGFPATGAQLGLDPTLVRPIERAMGWVSQMDRDSNLVITQDEVTTVPRSLLNKALVAQAVFDNKFLLPFAPDPPTFFLIPGNNQVTIAWQKSETETVKPGGGDPYFAISSDPTSALYDPNFRQYDVEGYRIYRGRTTGDLRLVAQFDYAGTTIVDFTGSFAYTEDLGDGPGVADTFPDGIVACAPELGVQDDCPDTDPNSPGRQVFPAIPNPTFSVDHSLVGEVVQVREGGRVRLANGSILILQADTAVSGGGSGGFPELSDAGVTFAFVDRSVRSSFTYFYTVTAFDVNSLASGPSAIESARVTKSVTPRGAGTNTTATALVQGVFGADGTELNTAAQYPAIDPANGTFSGNMPPANDAALVLGSAVLEALPPGDISVVIDSVGPGFTGGIGAPPNLYVSMSAGGTTIQRTIPLAEPTFAATGDVAYSFDQALVPYDSVNARKFGIAFTQDVRMPITYGGSTVPVVRTSGGVALAAGRFGIIGAGSRYLAHSRWFSGSSEPADPTIMGVPDSAHNSGALPGVALIWAPQAYRDLGTGQPASTINLNLRGYSYAQTAWYPGDFLVTWNADSSLTVFDSTHRGPLPFAPNGGTGWGFINQRAFAGAGVTTPELEDGTGTPNAAVVGYHHIYGTQPTCYPDWWVITCAPLEQKAQVQPLDFNFNGVADANGIALMVNGEAFLMALSGGQLPAAGTQWRLRAVSGTMTATCTPGLGVIMTDCSSYTFAASSARPSFAPGLTYKITVEAQYAVDAAASGDLSAVHTVPDPYYVSNALEATANTKILKFVNLPSRAIIRIYSVSGVLVNALTHNDAGGSGEATWNLRNRNNQFVASGVYFFHVEGPDGKSKVGRFTVVNFAP